MYFTRMLMEEEAPAQLGYERIKYNFMESSTVVKTMAEVGIKPDVNMPLLYTDHMGNPALRKMIGQDYGLGPQNVLVCTGSCMSLLVIYATLLGPGEHAVVMQPNYTANIEIAKSLGCDLDLFCPKFENGFQPDMGELRALIKPNTKLVNITYPHNPTGTMIDKATLMEISELCRENGSYLLVDEAYRDITHGEALPHGASLGRHVISIETLSKGVGIPGIRSGWIVAADEDLILKFLATKEQVCICGSIVDEDYARQVMERKEQLMPYIHRDMMEKFAIVKDFMANQDVLEWVEPGGGVVCLPRIKPQIKLDAADFYEALNNKYGVFVGPGRWFYMDDRFFRLGFGSSSAQKLKEGLPLILKAVADAKK